MFLRVELLLGSLWRSFLFLCIYLLSWMDQSILVRTCLLLVCIFWCRRDRRFIDYRVFRVLEWILIRYPSRVMFSVSGQLFGFSLQFFISARISVSFVRSHWPFARGLYGEVVCLIMLILSQVLLRISLTNSVPLSDIMHLWGPYVQMWFNMRFHLLLSFLVESPMRT